MKYVVMREENGTVFRVCGAVAVYELSSGGEVQYRGALEKLRSWKRPRGVSWFKLAA